MVDAQIELVAIDVRPHSENVVGAAPAANPYVVAPVQSVMRREIIRQRHLLKDAAHQRIEFPPIWIPGSKHAIHIATEQIERRKRPRGTCRPYRVSLEIHAWDV